MTLDALIARVGEATGPDRSIDGQLAVLAGWEWHGGGTVDEHWEFAGHWVKPGFPTNGSFGKRSEGLCDCNVISERYGNDEDVPRFTASLDAAVNLVEEKVPPHPHAIDQDRSDITLRFGTWGAQATIDRDTFRGGRKFDGFGHTPALALLSAILLAIQHGKEA